MQLVQALELNHDDAGRGCCTFIGYGLTSADEEFAARVGKRLRDERKVILIISVLVLDCDLGDVVSRRLGLGMKGLNCRSAERMPPSRGRTLGRVARKVKTAPSVGRSA